MLARLGRLIAVLALVVTGSVMSGVTPAQAVTCYGDYCSGKDPMQTGCNNGAYTTTYKNVPGGQLQVRWSPTCKTNWARLVVYPTGLGCISGGNLVAKQDTGYTQRKWLGVYICQISSTTTYWTPMIYSPVRHVRGEFGGIVTAWS